MRHQTLAEALALAWLHTLAVSCGLVAESIDRRRRERQKAARPPRSVAPQPLQPPSWLNR